MKSFNFEEKMIQSIDFLEDLGNNFNYLEIKSYEFYLILS